MLNIAHERHRLANGLRVVLSRDLGAPVVAVNLWYGVGSRHESPGRTGLAHLFEHLMFQGSAHVSKNGYSESVERAGGTWNGTTSFDRTNYYSVLPPEQVELALWLESDRMGWMLPALDQEKLDNQRDVVKNEKREAYDNQPYGDWQERILPMVFGEGHPYSHPVIGSMADIEAASLDDVSAFFQRHYAPSNAVLTIAGHFEQDRALALVERYFGSVGSNGFVNSPDGLPLDPVIGDTVRSDVESAVPLPRAFVASRIPPVMDPEFAVSEIAVALLGMGRAARLHRRLVRERRVARNAWAGAVNLVAGAGMLITSATGFPGGDPRELADALTEEVEALTGAEEREVERALAVCESATACALERMGTRADTLSMFEMHFGDPGRINHEIDRLRAVKIEDVREFASERLNSANRAVLTYRPNGAAV